MSQTVSPQNPAEQQSITASANQPHQPWQLERDRELLKVLYAQRDEQVQQLSVLQLAAAKQKSIDIVEHQIAMLNHAIRRAEEQAELHARQTEIRRVD
jgi:hypothetical protein